jgi:protein phosphatase
MLVRAVGVEKTVTVDTFILDYEDTISLLLCSDGLSGYCSDEEIYKVISETSFDEVAEGLIELALNKGGRDNITVAVISD